MLQRARPSPTRRSGDFFAVVGHRGAPCQQVENTLPSFQTALAHGANGVELDLCVTRDGEVVVWHDFDPCARNALLRRLGLEPDVQYRPRSPDNARYRRCVDQLTLQELRQHFGYADKTAGSERVEAHLPTLEDFMQFAVTQPELCIVFLDIKLPSDRAPLLRPLLTRLDRLASELQPRFEIVLETAFPSIVRALAELAPHYATTLDVQPPAGIVLNPEKCSAARAALVNGGSWATPQKPRFTTFRGFDVHLAVAKYDVGLLAQAHRPGSNGGVCSFTINEKHQMEQLIAAGVTAIQSDVPRLLREVAQQLGRNMSHAASGQLEPRIQQPR